MRLNDIFPLFEDAYTAKTLDYAIKLHDIDGLQWPIVANRVGHPLNSLMVTISKYRRGLWKGEHADRIQKDRASIEAMIEQGLSIADMADRFGIGYTAMYTRLQRMGFDAETIGEYQAHLPPKHDRKPIVKSQIVAALRSGKSNAQIGRELGWSSSGFDRQMQKIGLDRPTCDRIRDEGRRSVQ